MFNPLGFMFSSSRKIRSLRKKWDRIREKTLKKSPEMRTTLLPKEDQIEQNLRILEERRLHHGERARLMKEVEIDLAEVKANLDSNPDKRPPQKEVVQKEQQKVNEQAY
ncbi:MAG: hypothetical protein JW789_03205 [Candidatus Aenigmarchaeota archaeon]|nr:hypothetical protein [Candidatus Aenigmarchaeota archaeon]